MLFTTGQTDASLVSNFSATAAFTGTGARSVLLSSGIGALVGGQTITAGTPTAISDVYLLSVYDSTAAGNGSAWFNYEWIKCQVTLTNIGAVNFGISLLPAGVYVGQVFLSGGLTNTTYSNASGIFTYDPNTSSAAFVARANMGSARAFHGQSPLSTGDVLVSGGLSNSSTVVTTSQVYRFATNTWNTTVTMKRARFRHAQVTLQDGTILACGGRGPTSAGNALSFSEIFDPNTNLWAETGCMAFHRADHRLFLLPDGRVLAVGGVGYGAGVPALDELASCEVYDPRTSLWTVINPMSAARTAPVLECLPSLNRLYVTGDDGVLEYMDFATMVWRRSVAVRPVLRDAACSVVVSETFGDFLAVVGGTSGGDTDDTGFILVPASETVLMGGINQTLVRITSVPTADSFEFDTPAYQGYLTSISTGKSTAHAAPPAGTIPGPYTYDTKAGFGVTGTKKTLATALEAGQQYTTIQLNSSLADPTPAEAFPDEIGYLIFNFGFSDQVGPVRYFGRASETTLLLDSAFQFTADVNADSYVVLLKQKTVFVPDNPEDVGSFYVTDSNAGRVAADAMLTEVVATGVTTNRDVVYPSDTGLGGEGQPTKDNYKVSDAVTVWGGNDLDDVLTKARLT